MVPWKEGPVVYSGVNISSQFLAQMILSVFFKTLLCSLGTPPDPTLDQTIHVVEYNVSMAEA